MVVLYPILERTSIFSPVAGWLLPQNAAKPEPTSGIVIGGGSYGRK
jgi:hypothetical protein